MINNLLWFIKKSKLGRQKIHVRLNQILDMEDYKFYHLCHTTHRWILFCFFANVLITLSTSFIQYPTELILIQRTSKFAILMITHYKLETRAIIPHTIKTINYKSNFLVKRAPLFKKSPHILRRPPFFLLQIDWNFINFNCMNFLN